MKEHLKQPKEFPMTIAEIVELESARQEESSWNVIHFVKEGDFYRAHDWSAWLMSVYPFGEAVEKPLKVIAKKMKDGYIDAFCGFPASSIGKYIPQGMDFQPVSDTQIDVRIEFPAEIGEVSFENLSKKKEDWKNGLTLTEGKKQRRENREDTEQAPRIVRFTDIISKIVSMPIEDMSPKEAWDALRELRRQVTALF